MHVTTAVRWIILRASRCVPELQIQRHSSCLKGNSSILFKSQMCMIMSKNIDLVYHKHTMSSVPDVSWSVYSNRTKENHKSCHFSSTSMEISSCYSKREKSLLWTPGATWWHSKSTGCWKQLVLWAHSHVIPPVSHKDGRPHTEVSNESLLRRLKIA